MSDFLSQDEIESLLSSLSAADEPQAVSSQVHEQSGDTLENKTVVTYDFRSSDRLTREQLRGIRTLMEHFTRQYALALSAVLRVPVRGEARNAEQLDYSGFIQSLGPSVLYVLESPGLRKHWILQVSHDLIMIAVDRLLGGPGMPTDDMERPPSEIELKLVDRLIVRVLSTLEEIWRHLLPLKLSLSSVETDVEIAQVYPHSESVIVTPVVFEIKDSTVAFSLCIPYSEIKPLGQQLAGRLWEAARSTVDDSAPYELAQNLTKARLEVVSSFPSRDLSLRQVAALRPGDVLTFPARKDTPSVELRVSGRLKFIGAPGIRGNHLAVAIAREVAG